MKWRRGVDVSSSASEGAWIPENLNRTIKTINSQRTVCMDLQAIVGENWEWYHLSKCAFPVVYHWQHHSQELEGRHRGRAGQRKRRTDWKSMLGWRKQEVWKASEHCACIPLDPVYIHWEVKSRTVRLLEHRPTKQYAFTSSPSWWASERQDPNQNQRSESPRLHPECKGNWILASGTKLGDKYLRTPWNFL